MLFAVMSPSINSLGAFSYVEKISALADFSVCRRLVRSGRCQPSQRVLELDSIKGIGPAISTKILDERKKGNFKDWNDFISRVNGLGEKNAAKFSAQGMTINGSAYSGAPAPAPAPKEKAQRRNKSLSLPYRTHSATAGFFYV